MTKDFFTPKLTGERFKDNTVPVDVLPDIKALKELLTELAKDAYKKQHPKRKRAPRHFERVVQVHLAAVDTGSAKLKLVLFFAGLVTPYADAFEQARRTVTEAVAAAGRGEQPQLDQRYLAYFDRIGQSLWPEESMDFPADYGYAPLNQETRHRLIKAAQMVEWTDTEILRSRVSSTNLRTEKFELHLLDGTAISGDLKPTVREQLRSANAAYGKGKEEWLLLRCVVRKDRTGKISGVESIEDATLLEPLDVPLRLWEISKLQDGWLDGEGIAPPADGLQWLSSEFEDNFDADLPLPYVYPAPDGGVQAEWDMGPWSLSLSLDLLRRTGRFHALHLRTDEAREQDFDFSTSEGWDALNEAVGTLSAESEEAVAG